MFNASSGEPVNLFEHQLQAALLSPLPALADLDLDHARLNREEVTVSGAKVTCIMVVPAMLSNRNLQPIPLGLFPTFCFDSRMPVLRTSYSYGTFTTGFGKIVKFQNHYLSRAIEIAQGKRKILTATVDTIEPITSENPALAPAPDARSLPQSAADLSSGIMAGMLVKKQAPAYLDDAKAARISGRRPESPPMEPSTTFTWSTRLGRLWPRPRSRPSTNGNTSPTC